MYNLSKNNVLWPTTSASRYPLSSHKGFVILKELLYVDGGANPLLILQTSSVFPQRTTIKRDCLFVTGQRDKSEACLMLKVTWDWGYLSERRSQEVSRNKRQNFFYSRKSTSYAMTRTSEKLSSLDKSLNQFEALFPPWKVDGRITLNKVLTVTVQTESHNTCVSSDGSRNMESTLFLGEDASAKSFNPHLWGLA